MLTSFSEANYRNIVIWCVYWSLAEMDMFSVFTYIVIFHILKVSEIKEKDKLGLLICFWFFNPKLWFTFSKWKRFIDMMYYRCLFTYILHVFNIANLNLWFLSREWKGLIDMIYRLSTYIFKIEFADIFPFTNFYANRSLIHICFPKAVYYKY